MLGRYQCNSVMITTKNKETHRVKEPSQEEDKELIIKQEEASQMEGSSANVGYCIEETIP